MMVSLEPHGMSFQWEERFSYKKKRERNMMLGRCYYNPLQKCLSKGEHCIRLVLLEIKL